MKQQQVVLISVLLAALLATQNSRAFEMVETGVSALSPDGKHVAVNIPAIFNLVLDTRGQNNGVKLTQTVLLGLVKVDMDRKRDESGKFIGPIKVSVGGVTMYDNKQTV